MNVRREKYQFHHNGIEKRKRNMDSIRLFREGYQEAGIKPDEEKSENVRLSKEKDRLAPK